MPISIARGTSRTFGRQMVQADGRTPSTAFVVTDALTCTVWAGDDRAQAAAPAASWVDATTAKFRVAFVPADTAGLEEGAYSLAVTATRGTDIVEIWRDVLNVLPRHGAATPAKAAYCTLQHMTTHAPWVHMVHQGETDQTGFLEQRIAARDWLDAVILANHRAPASIPLGAYGSLSASPAAFAALSGRRRSVGPDPHLRSLLDADKLMLRPAVVRVAAFKAISLVGLAQVGVNNQLAGYGRHFDDRAECDVACLTVEIDSNDDGTPDLVVPLGSTATLFT
jgi:hypothetical protein